MEELFQLGLTGARLHPGEGGLDLFATDDRIFVGH
jgi:hypothetical protein